MTLASVTSMSHLHVLKIRAWMSACCSPTPTPTHSECVSAWALAWVLVFYPRGRINLRKRGRAGRGGQGKSEDFLFKEETRRGDKERRQEEGRCR
jgi:hypothetical protein